MAIDTGQDVEDDFSLKPLRDKVSNAVSRAKNWITGVEHDALPPQDTNKVDPEDVRKATAGFAARDAAAPQPKTKPGQRIVAGKKVQPK